MKQFFSLMKKEFYHITRDVRTLIMMLLIPVILLLIFGFAITTEIKNTPFVVLDQSKSVLSQQLIEKIGGNEYFTFKRYLNSDQEIEASFQSGESKLALVIPSTFGSDTYKAENSGIQLLVDASDPNEASTIYNYAQIIVMQFQQQQAKISQMPYNIHIEVKMLYNPQLKSSYNIVPGIMGLILMLICAMMTSISIVREKEMGTMEILLVSPLKPTSVVLAKAVPYFLISMINVVCIISLAYFLLGVPIMGNLFLVFLLSVLFTLSALSLGLLISSVAETQQAAMIMSAIGLMLPSMMLSGLIFPIEGMPLPLRIVSNMIPAKWFIAAMRDVIIKGLGIQFVWKECLVLFSMTVFLLVVSIKKFKNRL